MKKLVIIFAIVVGILALFQSLYVEESVVMRALEVQGYSQIKIVEVDRYFGNMPDCGPLDFAKYTVRAKNSSGNEVEVFACTDWLGATLQSK